MICVARLNVSPLTAVALDMNVGMWYTCVAEIIPK